MIGAAGLAFAPALAASAGWVELGISHYDPDWELRDRETGLRGAAQVGTDQWFVTAFFNTIATARVDEPVVRLRGLPFEDWRELGAGYRLGDGTTNFVLAVSYAGVKLGNENRDGFWAGASVTRQFDKHWAGSLRLAYFDLTESDVRLTGELDYRATDRMSIVFRIDDFNEFDFTWYELGARWHWR